jgi:hypothetical protein
MSDFRAIFPKRHTFLPVIHVQDHRDGVTSVTLAHTIEQVEVARVNGADGVFLIGHGMHHLNLLFMQEKVRDAIPNYWIGVNCLDLGPEDVFAQVTNLVDGVWVDNAEVMEHSEEQPSAARIRNAKVLARYRGLYFGGVAFKYQRHVTDLARGARIATDYVDVVTTSGIGTGSKPSPDKITVMKSAIGNHPLAIASGMTAENVHEYLEADVFMVATGISKDFHTLDPKKVQAFAGKLNG